ncbi:LuxR C-terminal-related transcriptional regulator [Arthrobacter sp. H5]|uniref:LuxR C-terminal-related transcriptional regulator n=1 Tax=Arthrobacter sp. H5 TaxID=1267973 RepID=UPI0004809366|nr:LuxR C-terminal-related transcriptional regulator [Arthrobacter sp. H5]
MRQASLAEPAVLTARQRDILDLIVEGESNERISQLLRISNRTVAVHVSDILKRSGAASRTVLAVDELRRRLGGPQPAE